MANTEYFEYNNGIYPCPLCIAVGKDWKNDDFDESCCREIEDDVSARTYDTHFEEQKVRVDTFRKQEDDDYGSNITRSTTRNDVHY